APSLEPRRRPPGPIGAASADRPDGSGWSDARPGAGSLLAAYLPGVLRSGRHSPRRAGATDRRGLRPAADRGADHRLGSRPVERGEPLRRPRPRRAHAARGAGLRRLPWAAGDLRSAGGPLAGPGGAPGHPTRTGHGERALGHGRRGKAGVQLHRGGCRGRHDVRSRARLHPPAAPERSALRARGAGRRQRARPVTQRGAVPAALQRRRSRRALAGQLPDLRPVGAAARDRGPARSRCRTRRRVRRCGAPRGRPAHPGRREGGRAAPRRARGRAGDGRRGRPRADRGGPGAGGPHTSQVRAGARAALGGSAPAGHAARPARGTCGQACVARCWLL
ncbi:MAG: hypothetical protein AVDCRST_MAG60-519, partial [uncultured Nocardioides sp.]